MKTKRADVVPSTLSLFRGRCAHRWVGAAHGYFGCPLCGDADGDHHLVSEEPIAAQPDDWGTAWGEICQLIAAPC